ncbi:hypothetical protein JCM19297_1368 [Nonlabens ulvanivorans]|nr:hypothetical protein [Nonlabens ulvanivorans]GAK89540.1 hypothetical protein JCM19297_1368 [Nonlabens ulvanivorans]
MRSLLFFFLLLCHLSIAQQPVSIHLTEDDGLPDKEFYGIAEDSKVYMVCW